MYLEKEHLKSLYSAMFKGSICVHGNSKYIYTHMSYVNLIS